MKHKCQSALWRCAVRGQHPRTVVYPAFDTTIGRAVWIIQAPLSENRLVSPPGTTHEQAMTAARRVAAGMEVTW